MCQTGSEKLRGGQPIGRPPRSFENRGNQISALQEQLTPDAHGRLPGAPPRMWESAFSGETILGTVFLRFVSEELTPRTRYQRDA